MNNDFIDSNIQGNRVQSALLIVAMVCILALIGFALGGIVGAVGAFALCVLAITFGPSISPQIILRMYRARPIPRSASPELYDLFAELVRRAELPAAPTLYYVPSRTLNAFAVGKSTHAAVAITDGLLRMLDAREIAGVLAHEVSHIRHRDMWVLGIADTVSRIIGTLSQIGQVMLLLAVPTFLMNGSHVFLVAALLLMGSPIISNLLQLALSRSREFNADLGAVALTHDARGLASALAKLERITSGTGLPLDDPWKKKSNSSGAVADAPADGGTDSSNHGSRQVTRQRTVRARRKDPRETLDTERLPARSPRPPLAQGWAVVLGERLRNVSRDT